MPNEIIECGCGCGQTLERFDRYGRERRFVNGHAVRLRKIHADEAARKTAWVRNHRKQRSDYIRDRAQRIRKDLLLSLGTSCAECGKPYDPETAGGWDFVAHHSDPTTKDFEIGATAANKYSLRALRKEAKKCVLLCRSCHAIVHHRLRKRLIT